MIDTEFISTDTLILCKGDTAQVGNNLYTSAGIYTDTLISFSGCDSIITTVIQMYTTSSSGIIQGSIQVLQGLTESYIPFPSNPSSTYTWGTTFNNIIYSSASGDSIAITFLIAGTELIYLIETSVEGCVTDTIWMQIKVQAHTGINQILIDKLNIYPNPSRGIFNIEFNSLSEEDIEIKILNSLGEIVYFTNLKKYKGEYLNQISLEKYPKAIYFLEIKIKQQVINKKLILQ